MTRSGAERAALVATRPNGHLAGSLQFCTAAPLMRQPVSPITTTREGSACGSGNALPRTEAARAEAGIANSQAGRRPSGTGILTVMRLAAPSTVREGQSFAEFTTTRAT